MHRNGDRMVCAAVDCEASVPVDEERAEAFVSVEEQAETELIETDDSMVDEGLPTTDSVRCDDCGNERAWYTLKQTASADEPPTRFFKCTECGHRWRGYN